MSTLCFPDFDIPATGGAPFNLAAARGKTLVVYYSAGGHTKNVANYIAKATNGDVMELKPAGLYGSGSGLQ